MIRFQELKLEQLPNPNSDALLESLRVQYHDRKIPIIISAFIVLIKPTQPPDTIRPYLFPAHTILTKFLKTEYSRLYPDTFIYVQITNKCTVCILYAIFLPIRSKILPLKRGKCCSQEKVVNYILITILRF